MKKLVSICAICLLSASSLFAAKPLKVASGSLDVLKSDATATWSIDLSNAVFEKDGDFKTWCGPEYDERVKLMNEAFYNGFNNYSAGLKLVKGGKAPYKLVFKVREFERKQGPGMWGSCFIKVYGTLEIEDTATGEKVLVLDVDGVKGDTDFVETDRFPKIMDWLCRDIFKLKK
ncbi:MAG: hypothetical protein J6X99_03985 [Bacteroidales bacterium]|nr:hypothetical protein [Bacteroidales bacterium]